MTGDPAVSRGGAHCPNRVQVGGAPAGRSGTVHTQLMLSSTRASWATAPNLQGQTGAGADSSSALHWQAWPTSPRPPPPPTPSDPGACNLEQQSSIHGSNRYRGRHSEGTPGESKVPLPTSTQQCNKGDVQTTPRQKEMQALGCGGGEEGRWPRCSMDSADCKGPGSLREALCCQARTARAAGPGRGQCWEVPDTRPQCWDPELSCTLLNSSLGLLKTNPLLPRYKPSQAS